MENISEILAAAGLHNETVARYVEHWSGITQPDKVEVISAKSDNRLIAGGLTSGETASAGGGLYYFCSYYKDTARSEKRTVVVTRRPNDKGAYNNWRNADQVIATQVEHMRGASKDKTVYVIPYLMTPPRSPLEKWAHGVKLTGNLTVVLHMIRMARIGVEYLNNLANPDEFIKTVRVAGDLENLGQGTPEDKRLFATMTDDRTVLHFGPSCGGNALLGRIAHGLCQAAYNGWDSKESLSEQFMLIGIKDKQENRTYYVCGGLPSASGKTNLAMILAPDALGDRYEVHFHGDDTAWLRVGEDGRIYGMNPKYDAFRVAKDTNWKSNSTAMEAIEPDAKTLFTSVAYNPGTQGLWQKGKTPEHPEDIAGWTDWKGNKITDRPVEHQRSKIKGGEWAHPNSRFTTSLKSVPDVAPNYEDSKGVSIDAIIFDGRVRDHEPLIHAITDLAKSAYDGLALGAQVTFAAEGKEGILRYDPMSMRPLMSYPEGEHVRHWLRIIGQAEHQPIFAYVNWFQKDPEDDHFRWSGYRDNLHALLWLLNLKEGRTQGKQTPVGIIPLKEELNLDGFEGDPADLGAVSSINIELWKREMGYREERLKQFEGLPEEVWGTHRRVMATLG